MSRTVARRIQSARQDSSAGVTGRPRDSVVTGLAVSVVMSSAPSRAEGGALPERADRACVDGQPAAAGWRGQRRQLRAPSVQFSVRYVKVDGAGLDVDADDVAVADEPERAARRTLRADLGHRDALVDEPGQLSVGDHGD